MTFDITSLDATEKRGFDVPVVFDENADPVAGFTCVGKNSKEYRAMQRQQQIRAIKRSSVRAAQPDGKTDEGAAFYLDSGEENTMELAVASVIGLFGFSQDGAEMAMSAVNVESLFEKRPTWRDKVIAAIEADANFTKG